MYQPVTQTQNSEASQLQPHFQTTSIGHFTQLLRPWQLFVTQIDPKWNWLDSVSSKSRTCHNFQFSSCGAFHGKCGPASSVLVIGWKRPTDGGDRWFLCHRRPSQWSSLIFRFEFSKKKCTFVVKKKKTPEKKKRIRNIHHVLKNRSLVPQRNLMCANHFGTREVTSMLCLRVLFQIQSVSRSCHIMDPTVCNGYTKFLVVNQLNIEEILGSVGLKQNQVILS